MKKIGVLTLYYKSTNYGGLLQAYALVEILNRMGFDAVQICYDAVAGYSFAHKVKIKLEGLVRFMRRPSQELELQKNLRIRQRMILNFGESKIRHSDRVYTKENIEDSCDVYDCFIAGSDQIWNRIAGVYFLDFVKGKPKYSYAASIGREQFSLEEIEKMKNYLQSFSGISIREKNGAEIVGKFTGQDVRWLVDPTLLLTREEWDSVCTERRVKQQYCFCYFLGADVEMRQVVQQYAEEQGLVIVMIPHLQRKYEVADKDFGDMKLYDVDPGDFISLIKYADCVFTDSFHASVFSGIYHKNFFAFHRAKAKAMGTRLYSLVQLYDCRDHFLDEIDKVSVHYIKSVPNIDYASADKNIERTRQASFEFLRKIEA